MAFQEQDRQEVIKALDELTAEGYWDKLNEASKQPGFSEDPVVSAPSNDKPPIAAPAGSGDVPEKERRKQAGQGKNNDNTDNT